MRMKLYELLVNRHSGIRSRYHKIHDNSDIGGKLVSYVYLLFLNFCYYCLFCRFLDREENPAMYEEKRLSELPESGRRPEERFTVEYFVDTLSQYDVVSFDVFDTLVFRPFSSPADLFWFLGDRLGLLDVRRIRMEQEALARRDCLEEKGHCEVTLQEIWNRMERETGISAERGMALEQELEMEFCYANPFLFQIFEALRARGKRIICISDMYLSQAFLAKLLEQNGYTGIEKLYVSCEYGKAKGGGGLYRLVREEFPLGTSFIHMGDNGQGDVRMAQKCGFAALCYPNVNKLSQSFRSYDMSPVIGGAYRGIVNNRLYRGGSAFSLEYEYGLIYGGLFVLGYCHFIHEYCCRHGVEKLLFLSRDGDILKEVYDRLYPGDNTAYVHWSRGAATKLMAEYDSYDYFRRFLYHKVNQGISVGEALEAMELQALNELLAGHAEEAGVSEKTEGTDMAGRPETDKGSEMPGRPETDKGSEMPGRPETDKGFEMPGRPETDKGFEMPGRPETDKGFEMPGRLETDKGFEMLGRLEMPGRPETDKGSEMPERLETAGRNGKPERIGGTEKRRPPGKQRKLQLSDELTDRNADALKRFIQSHYNVVRSTYQENQRAAQAYYEKELDGISHAAAVDIGWAGSGAVALSYLAEQVWELPCRITGIIAGTNTVHNEEPDAGEIFLQNGKLVSYLFSQSYNRDVMKKHDPNKDYNVYWELLLSSPQRRFLGFSFEEGEPTGVYSEDGREVLLRFGEQDANQEGILEIRRGILDFVSDYTEHFRKEPFMLRISGRDACAPMLVAASHGEKYLKRLARRFAPEKGI